MKQNFSKEVREAVIEVTSGICAYPYCPNKIEDFHHKIHNTKANRLTYPLFIQSIFNCIGLCREHHTDSSHEFNITLRLAEKYEEYLKNFKEGERCQQT